MPIAVEVSDEIPTLNKDAIPGLIELGAKQMRIEQALAIFRVRYRWHASGIAGLPLQEMTTHASARGFKPLFDDDRIAEELKLSKIVFKKMVKW